METQILKTKMDIKEMGWESVEWTYLAEDGDKWQVVGFHKCGKFLKQPTNCQFIPRTVPWR
jgi:hypothetical protein